MYYRGYCFDLHPFFLKFTSVIVPHPSIPFQTPRPAAVWGGTAFSLKMTSFFSKPLP